MLFADIHNDYLQYLSHEKGASRTTVDCYSSWLAHYVRWCDGEKIGATFLERFNVLMLRRYLYYQSNRGLRPRTIRGAFAPLRGLGAYATLQKLVTDDPTRSMRLPQADAPERPLISDEDLAALLAACDRIADSRRSTLARAMLSVLIFTGVRFSECLALKTADLDLSARTLQVRHGKGEKARTLYLCDEVVVTLSDWLVERAKLATRVVQGKWNDPGWLWQFDTKRGMGEVGTRQLIAEATHIAGLGDHPGAKPHSFRHAFATRLLRKGAEITAISASLGHHSLGTTWTYLHAASEPAKAMQELASLHVMTLPGQTESSMTGMPSAKSSNRTDHALRRRLPPTKERTR